MLKGMTTMFPNLEAEMARCQKTDNDIAKVIHKDIRTVRNKRNNVTAFTIMECFAIRDNLFPELEIEYLFEDNKRLGVV